MTFNILLTAVVIIAYAIAHLVIYAAIQIAKGKNK